MTGFAIFVIISLIFLGIGAILAIGSAASENKALKITAAVWVSISTVATIISVVIYHKAAKSMVVSSGYFNYDVLGNLRLFNYNPKLMKSYLESFIPKIYEDTKYLPYGKDFLHIIKEPMVELFLGKTETEQYASVAQVNQVWNNILDTAALNRAKYQLEYQLEQKIAKKAAKRSKE